MTQAWSFDEIQSRLDKITPGTWTAWDHESLMIGDKKPGVAQKVGLLYHNISILETCERRMEMTRSNVDFLAHAPEDIRYLLDLLKRIGS